MNKPAPLFPAAGLIGGLFACLLSLPIPVHAQEPATTAPGVESSASESKPGETTAPANDTEILATQGATFSAKDRVAVFSGSVRVKDPRFALGCDKLTVYIAKGAIPNTVLTSAPADTPAKTEEPAKSGDAQRGGGIDRAVAEGHVVIVQKHAPTKPGDEEKVSIGRADIVEFDNKTGDTILRGMPRVEQNGNVHEALSRATVMTLKSDNSLKTVGPSRTLIEPHGKDNLPGTKPGTTPPSAPSPGKRTSASTTQN